MDVPDTFVEGFHDAEKTKRMKYNKLGDTGLDVSLLSFGASSLGSVFRNTTEEESLKVVHEALKNGINYIDVAPWYGHGKAERVLGKVTNSLRDCEMLGYMKAGSLYRWVEVPLSCAFPGLRKALESVPRKSYYISTKVCRYEPEVEKMFDFTAERTIASVDESLARMGLDYVDVIQVHDMEFAPNLDIVINETLPALQKIKESGKAKFIGITGYPLENFRTVLERSSVKIDTILTYCHASMNDNSLADYLPYFKSKGIGIVNASPIGMGLLSNRGSPSWHPAHSDIKEACSQAASYCKEKDIDISKLAMEFTLSQPDIHTTLVSTASIDNLMKNINAVYTPLTDEEKAVQKDIMERFLKPLNNKTWEGVEVAIYRENLKEKGY